MLGEEGDALGRAVGGVVVDGLEARVERVEHHHAGLGGRDPRVGVERGCLRRRNAVGRLPPHQRPTPGIAAEERAQERGASAGQTGHDERGHDPLGANFRVISAPRDDPQAVREHPDDLGLEGQRRRSR